MITLPRYVVKCVTCEVVSLEIKGAEQEVIIDSQSKVGVINAFLNASKVHECSTDNIFNGELDYFNPYPTAFPYGNGMVLHFYQQQESSTTKTVHKVINKGLKTYV